ncbi:uncharacterized protein E5676_scaffold790G00920 [Cucumis melo var. makuwa]|uniref:RNase H type-1 domain-containing protein n=1 Tax=Cucumis melo var. makuwa TaxID=1194695 RepID=A0A5A7VK97_CUCMM|nr:uncharacterized protein E6C27_scaffold21G001830 [Cucumis melo var. makuwa]TYK15215.1 uncharacterized protein E5676_scaffold790G00920 [Cucumis melo var. makuwa]
MCLALFFAIDKLRHYMQAFMVHLVAKMDLIKYILSRSIIFACLANWAVLFQQYDIVYIPQKAIKEQALVDHPIPSDWKLCEDLLDDEVFFTKVVEPWTMYFDGAVRRSEIRVSFIEIYGDSKLIINQLSLQYDVKHENLMSYFAYARQLMERFDSVMLEHVSRAENKRVDALAYLAIALTIPGDITLNIPLFQQWIMPPILSECQEVNMTTFHFIDEEDWHQPIIEYLKHGMLPKDFHHKTDVRRRTAHFIYYKGTLYRCSLEGLFLRCLGKEESIKTLKEAHAGVCGVHQSRAKL